MTNPTMIAAARKNHAIGKPTYTARPIINAQIVINTHSMAAVYTERTGQ